MEEAHADHVWRYMQTSIQCYVKGDRESLPMSIKLIEMSTVICYLRSHCEVKAETLLEDKLDKDHFFLF